MRKYNAKLPERDRRCFTKGELDSVLEYCPDTGIFKWKIPVMCHGGGRKIGDVAGTSKDGYVQIKLFGKVYRAHHLAWFTMKGEWPSASVDMDHLDRDRSNNSWFNLRVTSRTQNNFNSDTRVDNTTGRKGVYRAGRKWFARIGLKGKIIHLGTFGTFNEAKLARQRAERKHFTHIGIMK